MAFARMVVTVVLIFHFAGCLWYLVAIIEVENGEKNTWLNYDHQIDASDYSRYIRAFYWSAALCFSVGYGDIPPVTVGEIVFTTVMTFMLASLFIYILATLAVCTQQN